MAGDMIIARKKFAERLMDDFQKKITGDNEEVIVGDNPENVFFVGKLLTKDSEESNTFSSSVFIDSLGVDFYISEKEMESAKITLYPKGNFYYRCYPTLEQQQEAMMKEAEKRFGRKFNSIEDLASACKANPDEFDNFKVKLIPVYKKKSIDSPNTYIQFKPAEILGESGEFGFLDETSSENGKLDDQIKYLMEQINNDDEYRYTYEISEETSVKDLTSFETYKLFLETQCTEDVIIQVNWCIHFNVEVRKIRNQYLVSVSLINDSIVPLNAESHMSNRQAKDKDTIETLFNSGIEIQLEGADFSPIKLDYFRDDYKYNGEQKAIGKNCSIEFDDQIPNKLRTVQLPTYYQDRLVTNDEMPVKFQDLIEDPLQTLKKVEEEMEREVQRWKDYYNQKISDPMGKDYDKMRSEIEEFEMEFCRFQNGIEVLTTESLALSSFKWMNQAFLNTSDKYDSWRLFQIVFIVSLIPDIVACEKENTYEMTYEKIQKTTLDQVSLLYFPTGGGKTEAFLGVLVFNLFFDRCRGKNFGVTAMLRYPLRLLSVQQVQRVSNVLAQAELIRREKEKEGIFKDKGAKEFSVGYYVGKENTPNKITNYQDKQDEDFQDMEQSELEQKYRILDKCPFCGQASVHLKFDNETHRLIHYCENQGCESGEALPLYITDEEIYRYLPSVIISTVDKLAIMGFNRNFRSILGGATCCCPKHGFTTTGKCLVNNCQEKLIEIDEADIHDPAPTLFIQDELHLIRESLGTYSSHYDSFIDYYLQKVSPSKRKAKIIGATATISHYQEQIFQLYGRNAVRFPCESIYLNKDFYSHIEEGNTQRIIMGFAPFGKAIINAVAYSLKYMREVVYQYLEDPQKVLNIDGISITTEEEAKKILEDYWVFIEYNNVKRDCNNLEGALETPINVELREEGVPPFNSGQMTGDISFQDIRSLLERVEDSENMLEDENIILATSTISHGVDADRFNVMFFYGIPGSTAEYVQAYSRTGRKYTGIIIDIIRPTRETDQSYLNNFVDFHKYKDFLVEPVPLNRWATNAIDKTLPGIFAGLLLAQYDLQTDKPLDIMKNIQTAINNNFIKKEEVREQLLQIYRCETDDIIEDLGNQYREDIYKFVDTIFEEIKGRNWTTEKISDGFKQMGFPIMSNLRDTGTQLTIELE